MNLPEDKLELFETFRREFESLGGKAYEASDVQQVASIISDIAIRGRIATAVKQKLEIDGEYQIAKELERNGVTIIQLEDSTDPIDVLNTADLTITRGDLLIARTGTLIMKTIRDDMRLASCLSRIHVAVVSGSRLISSTEESASYLRASLGSEDPCVISFISGPSRTADIEMKLILGVHGPHEVHVISFKG